MRAALALALLLLAPLAAAQAPPVRGGEVEPSWTFTPGEPAVRQGARLDMSAALEVLVRSAVCPQPGMLNVTVQLAAPDAPVGLELAPAALSWGFTVPMGAHGAAGQSEFAAQASQTLQVLVAPSVAPGTYAVQATVEGPLGVEGCVSTASPEPAAGGSLAWQAFTVRVVPRNFTEEFHPEHEEHGVGGFSLFLEPGASRSWQFNGTGAFPYHCHVHPELKGRIVVEAEGPARAEVRVSQQGFAPAEVRIGKGGQVAWTNPDRVPHTASADELHPEEDDGDEHLDEAPSTGANASAPPAPTPPPPARTPDAGAAGAALAAAAGALAAARRRR